jgi:glycosyltransferase involved in cell wall biosynthesis
MSPRRLSILVPMYNESEVIPVFFRTINGVLADTGMDYEIICVNDGSKDNTLELLAAEAARDPRVKVLSFSRNFGKEAAMTAALDYASGDAAIPIDADLQDPPELIHDMLRKWEEGFDVVFAKRSSRESDSLVKRKTARWFYNLFNRLSEVDIPENVGDYRLMSRRVLERALHERFVLLARIPVHNARIRAPGPRRRQHQIQLLEAMEFRLERHHLFQHYSDPDRDLSRPVHLRVRFRLRLLHHSLDLVLRHQGAGISFAHGGRAVPRGRAAVLFRLDGRVYRSHLQGSEKPPAVRGRAGRGFRG